MKYAENTVTFENPDGRKLTFKNAYIYLTNKVSVGDGFSDASYIIIRVPGADNEVPLPGEILEYDGKTFAVVLSRNNLKGLRPHLYIEARG